MKRRRGKPVKRMLPQLNFRNVKTKGELVITQDDLDVLAIYCPQGVQRLTWDKYVRTIKVRANVLGRDAIAMNYEGNGKFCVRPNRRSIRGYKFTVGPEFLPGRYLVIV